MFRICLSTYVNYYNILTLHILYYCIIMYYHVLSCIIMYYHVLSCIIMYYHVFFCCACNPEVIWTHLFLSCSVCYGEHEVSMDVNKYPKLYRDIQGYAGNLIG